MAQPIIIQADAQIGCPKCGHEFPVREGISAQAVDRYADEYARALADERKRIETDAGSRAAKDAEIRIATMRSEVADEQRREKEAREQIEKARESAAKAARESSEAEMKALRVAQVEKDAALARARESEIALRNKVREAEDARRNAEVEAQRKLDVERVAIAERERAAAKEDAQRQVAQMGEQLAQARREAEDLKRKLEQGSQQVQGEALEASLEGLLRAAFPLDAIEEVPKGITGADLVQRVRSASGQACGTIVWEAKQTRAWQQAWLGKLKDDQRAIGADLSVLVTSVMPKDVQDPFVRIDDVWVTRFAAVRPVAEALRTTLIEVHRQKVANSGRSEKMEVLYNYICSPQFVQKLKAIVDGVAAMQSDLAAERRAMNKHWARREQQIKRLTEGTFSIVGDLQGIGENALPQLDSIGALPGLDDDAEDA